jgi:flagellar protein FlaG
MATPNPVSTPAARIPADTVAIAPASAAPTATVKAVRPSHEADRADTRPAADAPENTAMQELVDVLKTTSIGLRFAIDDQTHRVITTVFDKETGEIIRQMPNEDVVRLARAIDKLQGLFVSHAV